MVANAYAEAGEGSRPVVHHAIRKGGKLLLGIAAAGKFLLDAIGMALGTAADSSRIVRSLHDEGVAQSALNARILALAQGSRDRAGGSAIRDAVHEGLFETGGGQVLRGRHP